MLITSIIIILISYALGCIAFGYYLVRWRTGQDLRQIGSGATGGRNAGRVLGKRATFAIGISDGLKGVLAVAIALWFNLEPWALALVMIAVLAGHVWPIQLGFRGGKGLSTAFGAVIVYDYRIALLTALVAITLLLLSKRNEFLFLSGMATSPIIAYFLGEQREIVAGVAILAGIILFAHRDNIRKILYPNNPPKDS